jgi:hypothetical protein
VNCCTISTSKIEKRDSHFLLQNSISFRKKDLPNFQGIFFLLEKNFITIIIIISQAFFLF